MKRYLEGRLGQLVKARRPAYFFESGQRDQFQVRLPNIFGTCRTSGG